MTLPNLETFYGTLNDFINSASAEAYLEHQLHMNTIGIWTMAIITAICLIGTIVFWLIQRYTYYDVDMIALIFTICFIFFAIIAAIVIPILCIENNLILNNPDVYILKYIVNK